MAWFMGKENRTFRVEDDNTVWSVNKVIQYDPITLTVINKGDIAPNPPAPPVVGERPAGREAYLKTLKYFSLKSEYKKVVGHPSQKMTVDELIAGILNKETA